MSVNTSITNALVVLVVIMLVAGLVMGLAFAGTDLFNPKTSTARANEIDRASEYQAQKDAIDLESYRQESDIRAAALEEQLRQEAEFRRQQQEQELAHQRELQALALKWFEIRQSVLLGVIAVTLLLAGGGLAFYLTSLGYRVLRQRHDPWQSAEWRESVRTLARSNEMLLRHLQLAGFQTGSPVVIGGNGHHREPVI